MEPLRSSCQPGQGSGSCPHLQTSNSAFHWPLHQRRRVQLHRANGSNFTSSDDGSNRDDNEDRNKNQDDRRLKASERSDNKLALDPMLN